MPDPRRAACPTTRTSLLDNRWPPASVRGTDPSASERIFRGFIDEPAPDHPRALPSAPPLRGPALEDCTLGGGVGRGDHAEPIAPSDEAPLRTRAKDELVMAAATSIGQQAGTIFKYVCVMVVGKLTDLFSIVGSAAEHLLR